MKFGRDVVMSIGILTALVGAAVPARAQTQITACGFNISTPGNYILKQDLNCPGGDGIDINASQVSLNLNNKKITCISSCGVGSEGINVNSLLALPGPNHVGIQGPGLISQFWDGINVYSTDYAQIALVTSTNNNNNGISATGDTYLTVGSNVLVRNLGVGLFLINSTNSVISYNDLSGNGDGLRLDGGTDNTANNNTASGNGAGTIRGWGILVKTKNARVYSNVTNGNNMGIEILASTSLNPVTGNKIFNNTSSRGNTVIDLKDDNVSCGSNFWSSNVFLTNSPSCVQ